MSRIANAWRALMGAEPVREVEVVLEVPVIGEAHRVRLYRASRRYYSSDFPKWNGNLYLTCEQAHSECPGAEVTVVEAVRIGSTYFTGYELTTKVQPKPKRAKGAK